MADSEDQQVSSTTSLFNEEVHHYQAEPDTERNQPAHDLFSADDIVDLVGGAKDALERHLAEDSAPYEFTETSSTPQEQLTLPEQEPVTVSEVMEPEPEGQENFPDSTSSSIVHRTTIITEESEVVAPKAELENTKSEPEPEPAPSRDALPAAEPRKAAPSPAEAAEQPAVTEQPPAPASCECPNGDK